MNTKRSQAEACATERVSEMFSPNWLNLQGITYANEDAEGSVAKVKEYCLSRVLLAVAVVICIAGWIAIKLRWNDSVGTAMMVIGIIGLITFGTTTWVNRCRERTVRLVDAWVKSFPFIETTQAWKQLVEQLERTGSKTQRLLESADGQFTDEFAVTWKTEMMRLIVVISEMPRHKQRSSPERGRMAEMFRVGKCLGIFKKGERWDKFWKESVGA